MFLCFAAAVKLSVGGETSSQLQAIENTIKRWFRSQEDTLKAIAKSEALKKLENQEMQAKLLEAAENANASNGGSVLMEVSVPQALAMAAGDAPEQQ